MGKISKYEWIDVGSSFVPNELSCAVLWGQLGDAESITEKRQQHYALYANGLQDLHESNKLKMCFVPNECRTNAHIFYIMLKDEETRLYYEEGLRQQGVSAFTHYIPLHSAPAGLKFGRLGSDMIITDQVYKTLLRLPIWIDLEPNQIRNIVKVIHDLAASI